MIVQACLNGARPAGFHPRLPITPAAIVLDARNAVRAGAQELHLHIRNQAGVETLDAAAVDDVLSGIRAHLPGTLLGVSTGAWIENDDSRRLAMIDRWRELPDYAAVNLSEADAPAVIQHLARRGIGVEAGLATPADAERLIELGLWACSLRILIELDDAEADIAALHAIADQILAILADAKVHKPILLHGAGRTMWSFIERAARQRFSTRVGLEDGDRRPDGTIAGGNADLVKAATAIMMRDRAAIGGE